MRAAILTVILLFAPALAYEISSINASSSTNVYKDWNLKAYITDGGAPVPSPNCTLEIIHGGTTEQFFTMIAQPEYAEYTTSFSSTGDRTAVVECYGVNGQKAFTIEPNSKLSISFNSPQKIGDSLKISANYEDISNYPITDGYCSATINPSDGTLSRVNLNFDAGTQKYNGYYTIVSSGYHDVEISCEAGSHSKLQKSKGFDINKVPVTILPTKTLIEGSFGDYQTVSIGVQPYTTTCSSNYGNMVKSSSYNYQLTVHLNFVGEKDVQVYCSAPGYDPNTKIVKFKSNEVSTRVELKFSTEKPHSFQSFSIEPNYYDINWNPISDSDCIVTINNQTQAVKSFKTAYFTAPAGPAQSSVSVKCEKMGYKTFSGVALFDIRPIEITLSLKHPESAKEGEIFGVEAVVFPKINANCELSGNLISPTEGKLAEVKDNNYIKESNSFMVQLNQSGDFHFEVKCAARGYSNATKSSDMRITIFSEGEEMQAAIILTILTTILAIGFMLIRKWI